MVFVKISRPSFFPNDLKKPDRKCPRQELNPHQSLRSALFYQLNYGGLPKL